MPKKLTGFFADYRRCNMTAPINKLMKLTILVLIDIYAVVLSLFITDIIRYDSLFVLFSVTNCLIFTASAVFFNLLFKCYQYLLRYTGLSDALRQCLSSVTNFMLLTVLIIISTKFLKSDTFSLITLKDAGLCVFFQFNLMILVRFSYRIEYAIFTYFMQRFGKGAKTKVIVFCKLDDCRAILERKMSYKNKKISAVICATPLYGKCSRINGVRICTGDIRALETAIKKHNADEVVISNDILEKSEMIHIYKICHTNKCLVKIYVGIEKPDPAEGPFRLLDINLEDLLGREQTLLNSDKIKNCIRGKTILVTGGAGSIGSEICRQVLDLKCEKLIVLDINENGLFELDNELKRQFDPSRFEIVVGSVCDNGCLRNIFYEHSINLVFHAAAHKHVPLMEANPGEAIKNNIFGTLNVASNAIAYAAEKLILISTDKAVNCTSIMGATKRVAEIIVQLLDRKAAVTELAVVRFGNVLGSNGSVIPTFLNQIKEGGPVTVTHPEVERYFMTIMEAVQLVLQAASMADGGEIFVLDMGKPIKILDLANDMIRLFGLEPGKDIQVKFTGLRPGEKMFEELSLENEQLRKTENNKISICSPISINADFLLKVKELEGIVNSQKDIDHKALLNEIIENACQ